MGDIRLLKTKKVLLEGRLQAICEVSTKPSLSSLLLLDRVNGDSGLKEPIKYRIQTLVYPNSIGNNVQIIGLYPSGSDTSTATKFMSGEELSFSHPTEIALFDTVLESSNNID